MTLAHARALLPGGGVVVEPHRPHRELAALRALGRWAARFSPLVAVDPPDGLLIDATGCERLFGGEGRLIRLIEGGVVRLGFRARVAVAPTFACAWAVARFGSRRRAHVGAGGEREALAALPPEALRVEPAVVDALREVGIERIGHLFDLPRSSLAARFGRELLRRLDQATGRAPETIDPIRPVTPAMVEWALAGPATQREAIELATGRLVEELSSLLEKRECGARQLDLRLDRLDARPLEVTVVLSRPSRDIKHLRTLLGPRLESIDLGGGVERLRLTASRLGRLPHEQLVSADGETVGEGGLDRVWGELLDVLSNRLGSQRVVRVEPVEAHLPERAFRIRSVGEKERHEGTRSRRTRTHEGPADRPSLLLERPEPITVMAMTPEGPPCWFRWRGLEQRIVASAGPERIAAPWWEARVTESRSHEEGAKAETERGQLHKTPSSYARAYARFMLGRELQATCADQSRKDTLSSNTSSLCNSVTPSLPTRDYFKIQDEQGRWLWIYRIPESGGWFVHGLWA